MLMALGMVSNAHTLATDPRTAALDLEEELKVSFSSPFIVHSHPSSLTYLSWISNVSTDLNTDDARVAVPCP